MKFKSKIDWWIHLAFALLPLTTICMIVSFILHGGIILAVTLIFVLLPNIFVIPMWTSTYYVLGESELLIKCGFIKQKIAYASIKNVKESRNPLASLALSVDRIEITFEKFGAVLISPQNKQEFLQQLEQKINYVKQSE